LSFGDLRVAQRAVEKIVIRSDVSMPRAPSVAFDPIAAGPP
jgi:hypothetical protein